MAICLQTGRTKDRARVVIFREQAQLDHGLLADVLRRHQLEERLEALDGVSTEVAKIFAANEERRHKLSDLPFREKVRAVIQLQEMAPVILRAREGC